MPPSPPEDVAEAETDKVLELAPDAPETVIEEAARRHLGLRTWERPALYRETAEAATDTDIPFWLVLLLSGAIATLGLVLNSTAVVIGAMLVAPLLGPLLGLSLALAVGDGRLFVQTAAAILLGATGIVLLAALLTLLLPFDAVTDEIASRTRPTTLDLAIAVFSGLAGAVVTASREARLSASIPGVAVAVALVPPLGVAGFGLATAKWAYVQGALLLFGANLAGIVLSGMLLFLLIGMNRAEVVKTARAWHETGAATGLAASLSHARWLDRLPGLASARTRVLLVVAFMAAVAIPLTSSLGEYVRESRISNAIARTVASLEENEDAFVIDQVVSYGDASTALRLRVATEGWISEADSESLAAQATDLAGEPITISLEQVLASSGDLEAFANALPDRPSVRTVAPTPSPTGTATVATLRGRLSDVLADLSLPDSVTVLGGSVEVDSDADGARLDVVVASPRRMAASMESVIARQAARALDLPPQAARVIPVILGVGAVPDSAAVVGVASTLAARSRLDVVLVGDSASVVNARRAIQARGVAASRIRSQRAGTGLAARLIVRPDSTARDR